MARVVQFTRPESLRHFSPALLVELLKRYPALLEAQGIQLPSDPSDDPMTYHRITELLLCADEMAGQSASLCETLHLVEQLSSRQGRDAIIQMAQHHGIAIEPEATATNHDLALWVWLRHPCILESVACRIKRHNSDSYFHYRPVNAQVAPMRCSPDTVQRFQHVLRSHYKSISKGSFVRILPVQQGDELWLVIRHGGHLKRHASINDETDAMGSICYRDEEYDMIIYNQIYGDLKIRYTNDKTLVSCQVSNVG